MAGIWVFAETCEQTLELLNAGMNLAKDLGVELVSFAQSDELAREYIRHGADEVLLLQPLAEDQPVESYVPVLAQAASEGDPDVFLIGATQRGKEIGARVAERLNTGLCSNCIGFELDLENRLLQMERLLFGGLAVQKVVCTTRPQMATVSPRTFDPAPLVESREGKIRELPAAPSSALTVISRTARARETVDITEAKIVVSVGRGFEKKEDMQLARRSRRRSRGRGGLFQAHRRRTTLASGGRIPGHIGQKDQARSLYWSWSFGADSTCNRNS